MIDKSIIEGTEEIILDTGIYIEYFQAEESELKKDLRELLFQEDSKIRLQGHYLLKSEIYYIMCRSLGRERAEDLIEEIEEFINFIDCGFLYRIVGQIKCKYHIVLSDCYSIAVGVFQKCPVLFLKEKELSDEIVNDINEEFNVEIHILS